VTLGSPTNWPGRETDPAFALQPSRDFDGGLVQRWSYQLTHADALAYLRLAQPSKWQKLAFGAAFFSWGAGVVLYMGDWGSANFVTVLAGGAVVAALAVLAVRGLRRRHKAAKLVPIPRPAVFEEWIDCIAATEIDSTDEAYLSPELIGEVIQTRTHIFVRSHSTTLVIPTRALDDPAALAAYLRELARGPYYFDAQD
jgi:hypothetical protein